MKHFTKKICALMLVVILCIPALTIHAAATPALSVTKRTISGVGQTYTLKVTNQPAGTTLTWASANKTIATVSSKGVVTAQKKGSTKITCTIKKGSTTVKKLSCTVTILVPSRMIRINNEVIDAKEKAHILKMGQTYDFNCTFTSTSTKSATSDKGYYVVEDPSIASVSDSGVVTPKKIGKTKLTVYAGKSKTTAVKATNPVQDYIYICVTDTPVQVTTVPVLSDSNNLVIQFSQPMLASTLIDTNGLLTKNISIIQRVNNNKFGSDLGLLTGSLSNDKKTLTIKSTNSFNGFYELRISKGALSLTGVPMEEYYIQELNLLDNVAPQYIGTTLDSSGLIASINFNKPLDITNLAVNNVKLNNVAVNNYFLSTASFYKLSSDKKSLLFNMGELSNAERSGTYSVELWGIKDLSGNFASYYTVSLFADTSTKPHPSLVSILRSGNSLVATFNLPIQNPGYISVENNIIYGSVNESNTKEVIYAFNSDYLTGLTGSRLVSISGFQGFNTATTNTSTEQRYVDFTANTNPLNLSSSTLTSETKNNIKKTVLTLTFNRNIASVPTTGTIYATAKGGSTVLPASSYTFTSSISGNVVKLEFTDTFAESAYYTFTLPADFAKDIYSNGNKSIDITVPKTGGLLVPLPAPVSIQLDELNSSIVYVTFNATLDFASAEQASNYTIEGIGVKSASILSSAENSPTVVKLTLASAVKNNLPYVITIANIKGYNGSYSTMELYKEQIFLHSSKTITILDTNGIASSNSIIMTTTGNISGSSTIDYTFTAGSKTLTLKGNPIINANTITFQFIEDLTAGTKVTMIPSLKNNIKDTSNNTLLNCMYTVTIK